MGSKKAYLEEQHKLVHGLIGREVDVILNRAKSVERIAPAPCTARQALWLESLLYMVLMNQAVGLGGRMGAAMFALLSVCVLLAFVQYVKAGRAS